MMKILSDSKQIKSFLGIEPLQSVSVRVTKACNLRCEQCYSFSGMKYDKELSLSEMKDMMKQLKDLGTLRIFFTGGEPFIRPDMMDILRYADKMRFAIYISTNGTIINRKTMRALKHLKHLKTFQVSIDGMEEMHDSIRGVPGTFEKAISVLKYAKKTLASDGMKVTVVFTLMKKNKHDAIKLQSCLKDIGIDTFAVVPLYPIKRLSDVEDISPQEKQTLFQDLCDHYYIKKGKTELAFLMPPGIIPQQLEKSEYGCGYICTFPSILGIDANGDVAPCDGLLSYKKFILGNLRDSSIEEIWDRPLMKKLRNFKLSDLKGVCKICRYLEFCAGGCRARSFVECGDLKSSHPLCQSFYDAGLFPDRNLRT